MGVDLAPSVARSRAAITQVAETHTIYCVYQFLIMAVPVISPSFKQPRAHTDNPDDIAAEWGLSDDINVFQKDIIYYQTWHYRHDKDG